MNPLTKLVQSVQKQLVVNAALKTALLTAAACILTFTITQQPLLLTLVALAATAAGVLLTGMIRSKKEEAVLLLHQKIQGTEYSLTLLEKESLNIAEQLQLERLGQQLHGQETPRLFLRQSLPYFLLVAGALIIHLLAPLFSARSSDSQNISNLEKQQKPTRTWLPPALQSAEVRIEPPAYTGLPVRETDDLMIRAVSGSVVQWRIQLKNPEAIRLQLVDSRGQEVAFQENNGLFSYKDRVRHSGIYSFKGYFKDSLVYQSDFYRLEVLPDAPPRIVPASKELYRYHTRQDPTKISVSARISDDFNVKQAFIVATVARGSGENVKFRELRIPLHSGSFKDANVSKTLDLKALQFAPGDELYYYWAALDNRQPEANFTKSDTYFIVFRDTTQLEEAELAAMAVNRMPEYFRSQRQIIIDTEKLIAKRKKIPAAEFNSTSNEIGFDQKVLRLRYGQFMGEEFETNIGGASHAAEGAQPAEGGNILDGFMHKHDTEEEHAAHAEEPDHDHGHDHGPAAADAQDPLAALMEQYVHAHDDGEVNTFYEQSTRSLLKMALEQMWQSELHLRLYEPEKALPFEKKALEYLKTAQQKARSYVKKSGFDPPPLKEKETRLTGELDKLNARYAQQRTYTQEQLAPKARRLLGYLELKKLSPSQQRDVQDAGALMAGLIINGNLKNWAALTGLQKLAAGQPRTAKEEQQLRAFLWSLTQASSQTPAAARGEQKLEEAFWRRLL
ncbi:hypothetical protein [Arundinibacter roseus]|uniref:DUF4175 family protein n=1 Tax=Arundinibacter roseus TaxID=2070510 RepID=A0A4R4K2W6_9BACT|nr:hypothetical protein [Arundinibacter roseus]TDB60806.1 hypothetical protein EZE20_20385 [Arundinibacter roseus]